MTAQFPDTIFIEDEKKPLYSTPSVLDPAGELSARIQFHEPSTALWRGYIACWRIAGDELSLIDLVGLATGAGPASKTDEGGAPIDWVITDGLVALTTLRFPTTPAASACATCTERTGPSSPNGSACLCSFRMERCCIVFMRGSGLRPRTSGALTFATDGSCATASSPIGAVSRPSRCRGGLAGNAGQDKARRNARLRSVYHRQTMSLQQATAIPATVMAMSTSELPASGK